ncbi:ferric-dicitrate binding protein FerR (iron transport regulator) [Pedobacter sp. AK017]|uniref:FecR family protein n=1 Tax=Pedobacter sp. AK017 TaxID=2723073 RepID=UPI00162214AC|nr:FecR family protein [Pedobacter sp. AK017]MBB5440978.1 ferric-dicitrate binding protein FerR (iron transport regulator) [Pedobacter sp. AK017]
MVAEVLVLMRNDEAYNWPVYHNGHVIGKISYNELMAFLDHKEDAGNIYSHKLHFDLGSVLVALRDMRTDKYKKPQQAISKKLVAGLSSVAVITMALIGLSWMFFKSSTVLPDENITTIVSDKIALTLGSGEQLLLDDTKKGVVINAGSLTYNDGTSIPVTSQKQAAGLTLHTPRGEQYQVTLPDGTKVWLNATSHLKFPSTFAGLTERRVSLDGEAYFEVAKISSNTNGKMRRIPFIVESKGQEIEVLGTHFDVRAYNNEAEVKTTLVEGSVRVTPSSRNNEPAKSPDPSLLDPMRTNGVKPAGYYLKSSQAVVLKPNQQAILTGSALAVKSIDVEEALAWKNGEFAFRNMPLENVMRIVACWYDVDVVYQNKTPDNALLGGTISKTANIVEVLDMLEVIANVKFKVEGRKVTVVQ